MAKRSVKLNHPPDDTAWGTDSIPTPVEQQTGVIIDVVLVSIWIDVEKFGKRKKQPDRALSPLKQVLKKEVFPLALDSPRTFFCSPLTCKSGMVVQCPSRGLASMRERERDECIGFETRSKMLKFLCGVEVYFILLVRDSAI